MAEEILKIHTAVLKAVAPVEASDFVP